MWLINKKTLAENLTVDAEKMGAWKRRLADPYMSMFLFWTWTCCFQCIFPNEKINTLGISSPKGLIQFPESVSTSASKFLCVISEAMVYFFRI